MLLSVASEINRGERCSFLSMINWSKTWLKIDSLFNFAAESDKALQLMFLSAEKVDFSQQMLC